MRRVRLLLWQLFNKTPLNLEIDEVAERAAAHAVRLAWEDYERLKAENLECWDKASKRRQLAKASGGFPAQPSRLKDYRTRTASVRRKGKEKLARSIHSKQIRRLIWSLRQSPSLRDMASW
jgi:division protein CdvB (Snf7/Vps24/ESCRT-III family)